MRRAVIGAVALVLAAGCGTSAPPRRQANPSAVPPVTAAAASSQARLPSLSTLLADLNLPPDAKPATSSARGDWGNANSPFAEDPGYTHKVRYWTTSLTPAGAIAAVQAKRLDGISGSSTGTAQDSLPTMSDTFEWPETAALYGPQVYVEANAVPGGDTEITAVAWQDVKPAKTEDEQIPTGVTSVDAAISVFQSTKPTLASLNGAEAQRLADDVNALWVKVTMINAGCGGSIYSSTWFTLTFHTASGSRTMSTGCNFVAPQGDTKAPLLYDSPALDNDLQLDFGRYLPAPYMGSSVAATAPPASATPTSPVDQGLLDLLREIPVSGDFSQVPAPADGETPGEPGYSDQPGYHSVVRYWTTSLPPDKAIAAMAAHPYPGLTGGVQGPYPSKGPADAEADYSAKPTSGLIGPRLQLYAVALPDGRSAVHAFAWEVDSSAKPAADRITGTVRSVTGSAASRSTTVKGDTAQQLVRDFNALLITAHPNHCAPNVFSVVLTFNTSKGDVVATDACGDVTLDEGRVVLEATDAFNLDVNHDFVSLLPTPLPSSAPLPTSQVTPSATATENADQVITDAPTSVTLDAVLPAAPGRQRWTDQTFVGTGALAQALVHDLQASQVLTGSAPAGCLQQDRRVTLKMESAGRQLRFVAWCLLVTGAADDPWLVAAPTLEKDIDAALASLTPTSSADPPADTTLDLTITTAGNLKDKRLLPLPGTQTVSQDGVVLGSRRLAAGEHWQLKVRQGLYTIKTTSPGHDCWTGTLTVPGGGGTESPGASCP